MSVQVRRHGVQHKTAVRQQAQGRQNQAEAMPQVALERHEAPGEERGMPPEHGGSQGNGTFEAPDGVAVAVATHHFEPSAAP